MSKLTITVLVFFTFVGGLGIGAYWGWRESAWTARQFIGPLASSQAGLCALTQYFVADDQAAEEALRDYLAFREDVHSKRANGSTDSSYGFDTTTTLTRLANVRLRSGDQEGARAYVERALRSCQAAGWKEECSEQRLREVVDRIDKSTLFYQMKHPKEQSEVRPTQGLQVDPQGARG